MGVDLRRLSFAPAWFAIMDGFMYLCLLAWIVGSQLLPSKDVDLLNGGQRLSSPWPENKLKIPFSSL